MKSDWLQDAPRLSANEADHLVEIWLRRRLQAPEQSYLDTGKLNLRELALALGTTEEELALMLCEIRDKKAPKRRVKKPIPVRRTLVFIAGIYVGLFGLCVLMWNLGFNSARATVTWSGEESPFMRRGTPAAYNRYEQGQTRLPESLGFRYRQTNEPAVRGIPTTDVDWSEAQKALVEAVAKVAHDGTQALVEKVSQVEIDKALAAGEGVEVVVPDPSTTFGEDPKLPSTLAGDHLVAWDVFTIEYEDRLIATPMPRPKVANPDLEKAVKQKVGERIAKLLEILHAGKQATPTPPVIR